MYIISIGNGIFGFRMGCLCDVGSDRVGSIGVDECPTGWGGGVGVIGWRTKDTRLLHPIFTLDPRGDVGPPREGTPETA